MENEKLLNKHRPKHIYDRRFLFITGRTLEGIKFFNNNEKKNIFVKKFSKLLDENGLAVYAWVLLENHYHALIRLPVETAKDEKYALAEFIRKLHSQTTAVLNRLDNVSGRKIWFQYWDYYLRNEKDFWKHFNYLLQNPLKHKLVKNWQECFTYQFSTNPHYLKLWSEEGVYECLEKNLVRDWTPTEGEFVE